MKHDDLDKLDRIDRAFAEGTPIDDALTAAVRAARRHHKEVGNPIVEWRNGEICWIAAEEIDVDEEG